MEWISVDDRLPDEQSRPEVLFYIQELERIELGQYNEFTGKWIMPSCDSYFMNGANWVTHWMPLPPPPTK